MQHRTISPVFYNQTSSAFVAHACAHTLDQSHCLFCP